MAQDKAFDLQVPEALSETGFLRHLLPRFSLKTGIRITATTEAGMAAFGPQGVPVFAQGDTIWHLSKTDGPYTDRFEEWLLSDIGKRTIEAFAPDGTPMFDANVTAKVAEEDVVFDGDVALGETVSLQQCGRCHVVNAKNRMNAMGSTPSFALMRNFGDWQQRFETFFLLKPHPAFTQVEDVTAPFADHLPSPIAPIEVTLDQIDAILAYVATIAPADLGAPIQAQ
ncbi:hypothetical protein [Algirhabdus cladophorae]|uniref:hypothetical protein n=1 Tax=Algirhabdus cladophorae TaxID=3377108 RepID=UPI003B8465B2